MTDFPTSIFSQRTIENKPGVTYDETKSTIGFAEDVTNLGDEITAIENELGEDGNHKIPRLADNETITGNRIFQGSIKIETADGLDIGTGADGDIDIITIDVAGTPKQWWDESEDAFKFSKKVIADSKPLLGLAGSATWENRTYEGYEVVDTATTYTIGSTGDYADLKAAADDLRKLILEADITLELQEDISSDHDVAIFKSLISQGGKLNIDLNGYDYTWTGSASQAIQFWGYFNVRLIEDAGTGGKFVFNPSTVDPPYEFILARGGAYLYVHSSVEIDMNGKANRTGIRAQETSLLRWHGATETGSGSLDWGLLTAQYGGRIVITSGTPTFDVRNAAMLIQVNGDIETSGGTLTPS